jgi:hypothetical protein
MGEWMYRSTFSWPRHYLEMSSQLHAPAALPPGKSSRYPLYRRLGGPPEPVWTTWRSNNSLPYRDSNHNLSVVQPVASRYTDCAIPAHVSQVAEPAKTRYVQLRVRLYTYLLTYRDFCLRLSDVVKRFICKLVWLYLLKWEIVYVGQLRFAFKMHTVKLLKRRQNPQVWSTLACFSSRILKYSSRQRSTSAYSTVQKLFHKAHSRIK